MISIPLMVQEYPPRFSWMFTSLPLAAPSISLVTTVADCMSTVTVWPGWAAVISCTTTFSSSSGSLEVSSGVSGTTGVSGTVGSSGVPGSVGFSGFTGVSGSAGSSGFSGSVGSSGSESSFTPYP
ncbi:MAG TPA: hypothetical protein IAA57_10360 [Candidatus Pullilachnospira intestinigallinarum]|nr:hypothetical protein [Candidatus Pullilachnospira intestinigallinarum]